MSEWRGNALRNTSRRVPVFTVARVNADMERGRENAAMAVSTQYSKTLFTYINNTTTNTRYYRYIKNAKTVINHHSFNFNK